MTRKVIVYCDLCGEKISKYTSQVRKRNYCSVEHFEESRRKSVSEPSSRMQVSSFTADLSTLQKLDEISNDRNVSRSEALRQIILENSK